MSLQADIQWIKSELDDVRDPDLIEVFKRLLAYRKTASESSFFATDVTALRNRAEASLRSVQEGKTRSVEEFKKDLSLWKAKHIS